MAPAHISSWRRMRRSRVPSNAPGRFFAVQFSAGCTTNMSAFDFRQAQPESGPNSSAEADWIRNGSRGELDQALFIELPTGVDMGDDPGGEVLQPDRGSSHLGDGASHFID